jgi:hypothetical protein
MGLIMKRFLPFLLFVAWASPALADRIYAAGFDPYHIDPQFPLVGGTYQLPPGPAADQLTWLIGELQTGQTTSLAEVQAHFTSGTDPQTMKNFIDSLRNTYYPNAKVTDVIAVTPVQVVVLLDSPSAPGTPHGFTVLHADYTGAHLINYLTVSDYYNIQYAADQTLTLVQAADKFATLSNAPAFVVARIRPNDTCEIIEDRNANTRRATGSIFKTWILGTLARAVTLGTVAVEDSITLTAGKLAPAGAINSEPLGTQFPVPDMATLMMGISDNTATDHVHALVGRSAIEQVVQDYGHSNPDAINPFLNISEQFHLFFSFAPATALGYVNGGETFQRQFLTSQIEPLGSMVGSPYTYSNYDFLTTGTWMASPMDICRAFMHLRHQPSGSDAMALVDRALGAQAAQPEVRDQWDRVWYKGGSLSASAGDYDVLTHAWMLENAGEDPWVVIGMSNQESGGIDQYKVQSVLGRVLELVAGM